MSGLPLQGIRVTDFTWVAAGPLCTRTLAMYGAQVIKVESSNRIDQTRTAQPIAPGKNGINVSGEWNSINPGKFSITVNMNHPRGRDLIWRLISLSDVVANNFSTGVMERWGFDYSSLAKIKPDIINLSMPVMGKDGPMKTFSGYGPGIAAMSGINSLMGEPGDLPVGFSMAYTDFGCNPYHAVVAIMAALIYRDGTGKGQDIDLSQYESTISYLGINVLQFGATGEVPSCNGNRSSCAAPHGVYLCRGDDRWCAIAIYTEEQWQAFAKVVGQRWILEERFSTIAGRLENVDELDDLVELWTKERDAFEVMEILQRLKIPAGVVQNTADLLDRDPQLKHRGFFATLDHPEAGSTVHVGSAFKLSGTPGMPNKRAPLQGEHNEIVFKEIMGVNEGEYTELLKDEVIQ